MTGPDRSVLRLLTFSPGDDGMTDAALRELTRALAERGAAVRLLGRRHGQQRERVVATVWPSAEAMRAGLGLGNREDEPATSLLEGIPGPADLRIEVLRVALALDFGRPDEPQVLRVYRGRVREGELDAYLEDARAGTIADGRNGGPLALYLGVDEPDRFVTVSSWSDWDRIEAATGGNIRNPVATRHPERLVEGTATHYEILPAE